MAWDVYLLIYFDFLIKFQPAKKGCVSYLAKMHTGWHRNREDLGIIMDWNYCTSHAYINQILSKLNKTQ